MQQELIDEQNAEIYGTVMKSEWDKYNAKYKNKIKYAPYQIPDKVAVFEGKNQISVPFFKMYGTTDHIQKAFDYINSRHHMAKVITEAGDAEKYPELVRPGKFEVVAITQDAYKDGYRAYSNGGYLNYINDLLKNNGFDIKKLTQYQKELIVMPMMAPENYHMDGEITVAQAMSIWLRKLSDAGLGRQDITKAVKMNFGKASDGSKIKSKKTAADGMGVSADIISKIESDGIISSKFGDSDMESIIYQYGAKIYQIITKSDGEKIIYDITPDESFIDEDDYMPARYKNGGEFGESQYYIVKAWDTDEDQRKGVAPEESKYGTRSEAVKWANHYHYEENFGVVEVEDENGNRVLTLNAYAKDGKMMVDFEVELGAEPNPDFDQNSHEGTVNIKKHRVRVKNMQEAKDKVVKFIMDNDLGSGNWVGGDIYQYGKKVGYISYNGRVWDNQGNSIAKDGTEIPERYRNMGFTKVGVKKKSTRPGKKWMVLAKKGDEYKVVHGGYEGMEDYSQHHDKLRRKRFWTRMGGFDSKKANDPFSPLYWHKKFGTWEDGGEA